MQAIPSLVYWNMESNLHHKHISNSQSLDEAIDAYQDLAAFCIEKRNQMVPTINYLQNKFEARVAHIEEICHEKVRATYAMLEILSRIASRSSSIRLEGHDDTDDAENIFNASGIELLNIFETFVHENEARSDGITSFESRANTAYKAAEFIVSNPERFAPCKPNIVQSKASLETLANNLRVYMLFEYCAIHGGIELIESPNIDHTIATKSDLHVDPLSAFMTRQTSLPMLKMNLRLAALDIVCKHPRLFTDREKDILHKARQRLIELGCHIDGSKIFSRKEKPLRHNEADEIVKTVLLSIFDTDKKPMLRTNREYRARMAKIRADFDSIIKDDFPETPQLWNPFFLRMLSILTLAEIAKEKRDTEYANLLGNFHDQLQQECPELEKIQNDLATGVDLLVQHSIPQQP